MQRRLVRSAAAVLLSSCAFAATAATFTVTSPDDSGPGTLRQAILDANATPGRDRIVLATDVAIDSSLPVITDPVDITSDAADTYDINVNLTFPGITRLHFGAGAAGSTVRSIDFGPFEIAIFIATSNVTVTDVFVHSARVVILGDDNVIGGSAASDANRIFFLEILGGERNVILGNTIPNVLLLGADDTELGTAAAGNILNVVTIQQTLSPVIRNNRIGILQISQFLTPGPGPTVIGNTINAGADTAVVLYTLSSGVVSNNIIAGATGIELIDSTGIAITGNSIVATGLAIDLNDDGATPNDPAPDADVGSNSLQNFPVLTSATLTPGSLIVEGTLASAPLTPYQIELFSNDAANPDARTFLGAFDVVTDATGNATFTETIMSPLPVAGEVITATATNRGVVAIPGSTPDSTSEVSAPIALALPGGLGFAAAAQSVDENAGTVTIVVTRTGGSDGTVTVDYATSNGTAVAPGDYTSTSGTLTFGPGITEQTIVVPITNDAIPEANETFTVTLGDPTGGATLGIATTTITIVDTDVAAAAIPTASTWALIAMALGLAFVALRR